jgi:polar amino acid transport system substrate-binding protein
MTIASVRALTALSLWVVTGLVHAQTAPLRLVHGDSYAPYSMQASGQALSGLLPAIAAAAFAGCPQVRLEQSAYPWSRAQAMVQSGEADALISVPTQTRLLTLEPSRAPLISTRVLAYAGSANPRIEQLRSARSLPDLRRFRIGAYASNGWAKEKLQGFSVDYSTPRPDTVFQMLSRARFDITIENAIVANYHLRQLGPDVAIEALPNLDFGRFSSHLLVRRDLPGLPALMACFDRELARLRASPRWDALWREAGVDPRAE